MKRFLGMLSMLLCMLLVPCALLKADQTEVYTFGDYQYTLKDGGAVIAGYTGDDAWIVIPKTLDGHEVRGIGASAFEKNKTIEAVTLPKTLVSIGERAFYGMENLKNVTLKKPDSINQQQTIGEYAFAACPHLIAVALPENVREIAENAFLGAERNPEPIFDKSEFHIRTEPSAYDVLKYAEEQQYEVFTHPDMEATRNVTVTATAKDKILLSWESVVFADRYRIYRDYGDDDSFVVTAEETLAGEVTELYFEDDYSRKDKLYKYYVEAVGTPYGSAEEKVSWYNEEEVNGALIGDDVYEMESLRAQPDSCTSLKLTWENEQYWPEDERDDRHYFYKIYRTREDSWELVQVVDDHKARSTVITGLKCGQEYTFAIQACADKKNKLFSESCYTNYSATAMVRPASPELTAIKKTSPTSVRLTWKKVDGATGYAVYRSAKKGGKYEKVGTVGAKNAPGFVDKGLKKGKTYYYKVVALRKVSGKNVKSKASRIRGKRI